ncbi:integrase core domain-containing protein [Mycobacterium sp.]|uniref:integrase core domain-containing protein n=1 Tax=Mycobacterium sp. TaxID=1785 RepID=UPI003BAE7EF2
MHPGRPQTNGHVERLHKTILEECWRPSFARYLHVTYGGLRQDLDQYLNLYNTDRAHNGRITQGRIPTDIIDPAHKMRPQTRHPPVATTRGESRLVRVTLIAPTDRFTFAPASVGAPFGNTSGRQFDLFRIANDLDAHLVIGTATSVDIEKRCVSLKGGEALPYNAFGDRLWSVRTPGRAGRHHVWRRRRH